jgi:hypothetical protein
MNIIYFGPNYEIEMEGLWLIRTPKIVIYIGVEFTEQHNEVRTQSDDGYFGINTYGWLGFP